MIQPRVGMRFEHSRVLNPDNTPMVYRVTKIAKRIVYYRPVDGGKPQFCDISEFHKWMKRVVSE